jgi:cyanophycin synthetase
MSDAAEALVELRVLDGPNLYFPRPAVKVSLSVTGLAQLPESDARDVASALGLAGVRPGSPGSGQRQRFAMRVLVLVVRRVAREAGTTRLAVRARAGARTDEIVVAFPWRHRTRAETLGRVVAEVSAALAAGHPGDLRAALTAAIHRGAAAVRRAPAGPGPDLVRPTIPVVSVTGTNGKTTTTRLIAHLGMAAGRTVGWNSTDGIYLQGTLLEAGDWSGPGGARRVLAAPGVQLGILETARGGLLLRGMGYASNDVAVVTNVSADHLGLHGIETLDQLAEVKAVVTRVTKPGGWLVLNGDDPRVLAMHRGARALPWVFSLDPDAPALRAALDAGGRAATVLDGDVVLLEPEADPDHVLPVVDVPLTLAGLSRENVANVLAAVAAASALDLPWAAVVEGLRTFRPDPAHNPGRLNLYTLHGVTVIVDLAHNEASLEALLHVATGVRVPGAVLRTVVGAPGDRPDAVVSALAEMAARASDGVAIAASPRYLRGRDVDELVALLRGGAAAVGVLQVPVWGTELAATQSLLAKSVAGDVVAVMCHAEREAIDGWLRAEGASVDGPDDVRAKVLAAGRMPRTGAGTPRR